jgi:dihydrodipicolinate synthase/N-acetylneuraminate lyase
VPDYTRTEARDWAREDMVGICGCLLPTLNSGLTEVNQEAIRHDIRLSKEFGYWGTLLVPETGTTESEFRTVIDVAVDEAQKVGLRTMLLTSFATLDAAVRMVRYAEAAGVDMVMPSYPAMFYPQSEDEVFEFTKTIADASALGMMLFTIHHWNFARLHPSGFSPRLMGRLLDEVPTVVAIKNEIGLPGVGGIGEVFQRFGDRVVVSDPFEQNAPAWVGGYDMRFVGTANYEYAGPKVAEYFAALRAGDLDRGMEIYWQIHPARQVNIQLTAEYMAGSNLINRLVWKYQGWLSGFNGGPVRPPAPRISDAQMRTARTGLERSGIEPATGTDADFFVGRNPMD